MHKDPRFEAGDIICTIGFVSNEEPSDWGEIEENKQLESMANSSDFTGVPLIVLYQEDPFVICQPACSPQSIISIDVRKYEFRIMSKTYLDYFKKAYCKSWEAWEREQSRDADNSL